MFTGAVDFSDMRTMLRTISSVVGEEYLVSCSWNGSLMRVSVGRAVAVTSEWRKPWVMTFDDEASYTLEPDELLDELARGAKAWFALSKDEAGEYEREYMLRLQSG